MLPNTLPNQSFWLVFIRWLTGGRARVERVREAESRSAAPARAFLIDEIQKLDLGCVLK